MKRKSVNVVTMGCSKNLVDSERVLKMLESRGFDAVHNASEFKGDIAVINTCGFIGDAKEESIEMILEAARAKTSHKLKSLYVMGCLSERYREELKAELPEVDGWYGKFDWTALADDLAGKFQTPSRLWERTLTTPSHHAYLKISEGCNRFCSFCAIPLITGRYKSRQPDEIIAEVEDLVAKGVREFNIIAQDLSSYGLDTEGRHTLAQLVDRIADVEGVEWIRLHYAYPADFPYDVLEVMARRSNVCKYLDVALQHINDTVLSNMRRHITADETRRFLQRVREAVPGIHIRTTLMVGFPGETDEAFERLVDFVREQRFERMGAFAYCEEEGTYGAQTFADDIPQEVKDERLGRLMAFQEEIALEVNEEKIGRTLRVIVDSENDDYYVGRTEFDSPEVDPEVLIVKDRTLEIGRFYDVEITSAMPFELIGKAV